MAYPPARCRRGCATPISQLASNGRPHERRPARIKVGSGPETIRVIKQALRDGALPETYVSAGTLVHIEQVSGDLTTVSDEDSPLPVAASPMNPAELAGLLAEHASVHRMNTAKDSNGEPETYKEETTPQREALSAALAAKT